MPPAHSCRLVTDELSGRARSAAVLLQRTS